MDWLLDVFATWLYGLKVIAITLAVIMFISGLDDFFIDVVYWVRRIKRKLSVYRRYPRMSYRELYKPDEKPLAIMVPDIAKKPIPVAKTASTVSGTPICPPHWT